MARLALTHGELDETGRLASRGATLAREAGTQAGEAGPEALAATVQSALSLTLGQVERARELAAQAFAAAGRVGDVDARRSTSLLKDYAPLAGRDIRLSARVNF